MTYHDPYSRRPPSHTHQTTTYTTYDDTPSSRYFARLSEKAAPSGTIHLHSYEPASASEAGRQPVYYARPPAERVVREVVTVQERGRAEKVVREQERVAGKEAEAEAEVRTPSGKGEEERGFVRGVAGKGAGAIWKALGGR